MGVFPVVFTAELYSAGLPNVEFVVYAVVVAAVLPVELLEALASDLFDLDEPAELVEAVILAADDELAVLALAASNPNENFSKEIIKKQKLGWTPKNTYFSVRPNGIVLALKFEKNDTPEKTDLRAYQAKFPLSGSFTTTKKILSGRDS